MAPRLRDSDLLLQLPRLDYIQDFSHLQHLTLKTFQVFLDERTSSDAASVFLASFLQQNFTEETLNLTTIIAEYEGTPALVRSTKSYADEVLSPAIDGYWKYLAKTVKQHFAPSVNHLSFTNFDGGVDGQNGVNEIAQALGATASLRLEYMRAEHNHLSPATMASRLLTNHVNDLAKEHGFRQKLEHNHDWGINFRETVMQRILLMCIVDLDIVIPSESFGEGFYRQQLQNYYQPYPVLRQVRLNPNGLPRDVERQFRRYFWGMYQQSLKQLR